MKLLKLLILSLVFSCSSKEVQVDDRLLPYYEVFLEETRSRGVYVDDSDYVIRFGRIKNYGECRPDRKEIIVGWDWYRGATTRDKPLDFQIEAMMAHECGHCLLGIIKHSDSVSLMMKMAYPFYEEIYIEYREWLWDDLINRAKWTR